MIRRLTKALSLLSLILMIAPADVAHGAGEKKYQPMTFEKLVISATNDALYKSDSKTRVIVLSILKKSGFNVVGGESFVFDVDNSRAARYVLGGIVDRVKCSRTNSSSHRVCDLSVLWQLFDNSHRKVAYETVTRAYRVYRNGAKFSHKGYLMLLSRALKKLTQKERFAAVLSRGDATSSRTDAVPVGEFRRCNTKALSLPKQMEKAMRATVIVKSGAAHGSGVGISKDGYILTAAHVVDGLLETTIQTKNGAQLKARVIRRDIRQDVALLKAEGDLPACLPVSLLLPKSGEQTYAVGTPADIGLSFSVTKGIVSGIRTIKGVQLIQTDTPINPGNSGGPLLDDKGQVVGIVTAKLAAVGVEGIAFASAGITAIGALGIVPGDTSSIKAEENGGVSKLTKIVDPHEQLPKEFCFKEEYGRGTMKSCLVIREDVD